MSEGNQVTVWSGQKQVVMDTLKRTGRYVSKREYVEQKYQDTAWCFKQAYQFLVEKGRERVPMPEGAEYPIWVYGQKHHIFPDYDMTCLKLEVPESELLLFDTRKWNKILNLDYLNLDQNDEMEFGQWLKQRGISQCLDIFRTPYYPIEKKKIIESWNRLFDDNIKDAAYVQGMVWEIKREWICEEYKYGGAK